MSTETPDIQDAIKIALASADTAGDAAAMAEKEAKSMSNKAEWVDRKLVPFGIGTLVAVVVCTGLSGLVYFRTLADLRTARDTHVEALHLFTQKVNDLSETVARTEDLINGQEATKTELAASLDGMSKRMATMEETLRQSSDATLAAFGAGAEGFAEKLSQTMDPRVDSIRDEVMAGMSDLHLALSQKLSALSKQVGDSAKMASQRPQTAADKQARAKTAAKPRPKPAPKKSSTATKKVKKASAPKNPFSYP
jgi:hypothetical protein